MRINRFGVNRTPQAVLLDNVLEDLQGRSFKLINDLELFHHVQRGRTTIRTLGAASNGLHFGIRRLPASKKTEALARGIEADFGLVAMEVVAHTFSIPTLGGVTVWRAETDHFELPVLARDVALISRRIMQEFLQYDATIPEVEISQELHDAYAVSETEWRRLCNSEWE